MNDGPAENIGTVDGPFDDDRPSGQNIVRSDAACTIPWLADGYQSVQVFVDPVLTDRATEICSALNAVTTTQPDLEALSEAIMRYAGGAGLSASIHADPKDALSVGNVAVALTVG